MRIRREFGGYRTCHRNSRVALPDDAGARILRVVTLEDGETIHNAFPDRGFREDDR